MVAFPRVKFGCVFDVCVAVVQNDAFFGFHYVEEIDEWRMQIQNNNGSDSKLFSVDRRTGEISQDISERRDNVHVFPSSQSWFRTALKHPGTLNALYFPFSNVMSSDMESQFDRGKKRYMGPN